MSEYPEHEKLKAIKPQSQAIGEFLEWLWSKKNIELAIKHQHGVSCLDEHERIRCGYSSGEYMPAFEDTRKILAEFFEIDEEKLEVEKRAMLKELRP